ncbi:hypothetical protein Poli38472_012767 [Pythium oligandrum]|uniref:Protein kinase domain-containing protein n=1 Tax=Pythium oligandrum TaxID=41045 RepID=A0A8K1FGF0_PYTOL|nr:hypothetical protein Poli38472_012767 [Pythium oligandrum]|eukprot:TMW61576.1 hypothetical protein Poli38472_012767 [Pythium oligandrum]
MSTRHSQFRLKRKLGQALYGDVWLCEDTRRENHDVVALKEVSLQTAKEALMRNPHMDNPWQERQMTRLIQKLGEHPNILQFHDEFVKSGSWFVVMEYCNGGDLFERLQNNAKGRFDEQMALKYFRQIAEGVSFLHRNEVAHRDLSLENVLLNDDGCKISDFGLSTDANRRCVERVGKSYYMAPEVVAADEYNPKAADVWSLGIMLFIMLTGSPLVQSASRQDKAFIALETFGVHKILDVWEMSSSISASTMDMLASMLHVNPAKRPSVEDVLAKCWP